jgi:glycine cleavage system H protein
LSEWKTVSIRQELIKEIEKIIHLGRYRSISEFVSEAIRLRLEEIMRMEGYSMDRHVAPLTTPEQLQYTPKHMWALTTPEGNVRVGISDYAQRHLRGVARMHVDPIGKEINKMDSFGTAETWMVMFDLYSPASGKIVKINEQLRTHPNIVNEDPYNKGWLVEIRPNNSLTCREEMDSLMSAKEYFEWVTKLEGRLK